MTDPTHETPAQAAERLRAKTTANTDGSPTLTSLDTPSEETSHDHHD